LAVTRLSTWRATLWRRRGGSRSWSRTRYSTPTCSAPARLSGTSRSRCLSRSAVMAVLEHAPDSGSRVRVTASPEGRITLQRKGTIMGEHHRRKSAKRPGRLFLAACATLIAALASSVARAEEPPVAVTAPAPAPAPRNKLALVAGLGSPWGDRVGAFASPSLPKPIRRAAYHGSSHGQIRPQQQTPGHLGFAAPATAIVARSSRREIKEGIKRRPSPFFTTDIRVPHGRNRANPVEGGAQGHPERA